MQAEKSARFCFAVFIIMAMLHPLPINSLGANFIAAITIQAVDNNNNMTSDSVLHMTCFEDEPLLLSKEDCCSELSQRLNELCEKKSIVNRSCVKGTIDDKSSQFYQYCTSTIAAVPHLEILKNRNDEAKIPSPRYYMNFPDETRTLHEHRFYQHAAHRSTPILQKNEPVYSPFHMSSVLLVEESVELDRENTPVGAVMSTLSTEGGMHRPYRHIVSIKQLDGKKFGEHFFGNVKVLLPISEGFFIDLDAPFKEDIENACHFRYAVAGAASNSIIQEGLLSDMAKCKVNAIVSSNLNIDIEQPSFVSPQHVVLLDVSFEFSTRYEVPISLEMDITTILHVRYPRPILKHEDGRRSGLIFVQVPPAYFYRGSIQSGHSNDGNGHDENSSLYMAIVTKVYNEEWKQNRLSLDVAAGQDDHYATVVIVTVFISISGALSMLRDLSKAAVWC